MRRHPQQKTSTPQNLDSFLDVLTNTVGVLMFVGLFVSLVAVEAGSIIRTPLVSNTKKISYSFEVRDQRVIDVVTNVVIVEQELAKRSLKACQKPQLSPEITKDNARYHIAEIERYIAQYDKSKSCLEANRKKLKDFRVTTPDYKVTVDSNSLSLVYQPLQVNTGTASQQAQNYPQLRSALSQLNPEVDYIVFIVRSDSFAEFRQARELAWKKGFDVGWEPYTTNKKLQFLPSILSDLGENRRILPQ